VFSRALHWSLSWARSIQSIPSHPHTLISTHSLFSRCCAVGEYTTTFSEKRLCEHVLAETNRHVNNRRAIAKQLLGKRVPAATDTQATGEVPLDCNNGKCFLCGSCRNVIIRVSQVPKSIVECGQFSRALQGRLRRDDAIVFALWPLIIERVQLRIGSRGQLCKGGWEEMAL
jgi:hypothetical protein